MMKLLIMVVSNDHNCRVAAFIERNLHEEPFF